MGTKKTYISLKAEKRLKRLRYLLNGLIAFLGFIVLYDSFVHGTPLYYVIFFWAGLIGGRVYRVLMQVEHKNPSEKISLQSSHWNIVLSIVLLLFRFYIGHQFLEFMHVVYTSDALYLIFIGLYRSKLKSLIWQIDDIVYRWVLKYSTRLP